MQERIILLYVEAGFLGESCQRAVNFRREISCITSPKRCFGPERETTAIIELKAMIDSIKYEDAAVFDEFILKVQRLWDHRRCRVCGL